MVSKSVMRKRVKHQPHRYLLIHFPGPSCKKYSSSAPKNPSLFIPLDTPKATAEFLQASLSASSWAKNNSVMKCFNEFSEKSPNIHDRPLSKASVEEFITWAAVVKKLKSNTIKSYLSSLNLAHKFRDLNGQNCVGFSAKMILRGIENLEFYKDISKESRKAMSFPLLKLLGHELAKSDWTIAKKATVWAACTIAFFGSFRLGEILPKKRNFIPAETLLWNDIVFRDNSITIHIRIPKNRCPSGEFVDIFEFKGHNCCPIAALKSLKKLKEN